MEQKNKISTRMLASGGILTAISVVLTFFKTPLPLIPSFLELNVSTIPALIGGFAFGPLAGVLIVLATQLIHMMVSHTAFVGELADFIMTGSLTLVASLIYANKKTRKRAIVGLALGIIAMTIAASFVNYFILLPFYSQAYMPMDKILEICSTVNPWIVDKLTYILYGAVPFNIIKGVILSVVTFILYKHISRF